MFNDLAIILVNWNLKIDTIECIESLLNSGVAHRQIVIVDNGSTDRSVNDFQEYYQNLIHIIEVKENLGYAAGANLGIRYAIDKSYKWILLLNNDTIVADNFLEEMHTAITNYPEYSILSPAIFYYQNPSIIWSLGSRCIDSTLLTVSPRKNHPLDQKILPIIPIDFANGCAMLVSVNVVEKIGLLDETLYMYGEEVDFCQRAKSYGFKIACFTPAFIWHKVSKSSQHEKSKTRYLRIRNQIIFYRRYSTIKMLWVYVIFTLIRITGIILLDLLNFRIALLMQSINGWLDGWSIDISRKNN